MTDDDPFDDIDADAYRDREGDPFDDLERDGDASTETDPGAASETGERSDTGSDPFEYLGDEDGRTAGTDADKSSDPDSDRAGKPVDVVTDPFSDVDVSRGDPFESANTPFEREAVDGVDPDEVWERFTADADSAESAGSTPPEDDVVEVSKHSFCERCPHFSSPPDVDCGHDGTSILEFVGTEQVRVANCPVVRERRELGEVHE